MASGDTVYFDDGVYNSPISGGAGDSLGGHGGAYTSNLTSGTASKYTRFIGKNRHAVIVDGQYARLPLLIWRKSYIEVNNIVFLHALCCFAPVTIDGSVAVSPQAPQATNIMIRNVGAAYPDPTATNAAGIGVEHGDNVLVEDSWVWGYGARYGISFHNGTNNIARRNITRYDRSPDGNPKAGLTLYSEDNSLAENNVTVDFDGTGDSTGDVHAAFFTTASVTLPDPPFGLATVGWYGNVAVNTSGQTNGVFFFDSLSSVLSYTGVGTIPLTGGTARPVITVVDNVIAKASGTTVAGLWASNDNPGTTTGDTHDIVFRHNTIYDINGGGRVVRIDAAPRWATVTFNDNLINNPTYPGISCFQDMHGSISATNNQNFNCTGSMPVGSVANLNADPVLSFLLRREAGTAGTASNSPASDAGDRGATIVKRYVNGVLTGTDLWPLPNEDIAKLDMCAGPDSAPTINTSGHNLTGWCASGKSLTRYIWEQLGNPSPY